MGDTVLLKIALNALASSMSSALPGALKAEADALADAIRARAPKGDSGNLARSVRVVSSSDGFSYSVVAGGDLTTKEIRGASGVKYEREVKIGTDDTQNIAKKAGGKGVTYDYARATEFGTVNEAAEPFFFNTYRSRKSGIKKRITQAAAAKLP